MKKKQPEPQLFQKGYETYAVTKGGKGIIKFSDNSDITTDRETSTVEVVPKGKAAPIKFVPRGRNNNMMYDVNTGIRKPEKSSKKKSCPKNTRIYSIL